MRVCWDLPVGFVGIGSEKSIDVVVHDTLENQVVALAIALEEVMVKKGSEKESDDDSDEEMEMDED